MSKQTGSTLHLKIVSLVIALTVFSLVAADRQSTQTAIFEVRLAESPEGYRLMNQLPSVKATLKGPSRAFKQVDPSRLQSIRIKNVTPEMDVYRLRRSNFDVPPELEVTDFSPREIRLDFQPLLPVETRVRPVTQGEPRAGFVVQNVRVEPETVTIRTPNGQWDNSSISTMPVDISDIDDDLVREVGLNVIDYSIDFDEDTRVTVFVDVEEQRKTIAVHDRPIEVVGPQEGTRRLSADAVDLTLEGPKEAIDAVDPAKVLVTVDLTEAIAQGSGRYRLEPSVFNLPEDVHVRSMSPNVVVVDLQLPETANPPNGSSEVEVGDRQ